MAPIPGAGPQPTPPGAGANPVVSSALAPLVGAAPVRDAQLLKRQLSEAFEQHLAELRQERGVVYTPEDTHSVIRKVADVADTAAAYADAFKALVTRAEAVLGEELLEAVGGDQQGVPARPMDVPHGDETIRLQLEFKTHRRIEADQVYTALVSLVDMEWADDDRDPTADPWGFALDCITRVINGLLPANTQPNPTKVEALAVALGRRGEDQLASVVRSAVGARQKEFRKVSVDRKAA